MKLLPSQQTETLKQLPAIMQQIDAGAIITLAEPCDCGERIQHNNGGNYHEILDVTRDGMEYFMRSDSTCELTPRAEWEVVTQDQIESAVRFALTQGWHIGQVEEDDIPSAFGTHQYHDIG